MQTVPADTPAAPAAAGLLARAVGIVTAPRRTLEAVVAHPSWVGMLVLTIGVAAACSGALLSTEAGQVALVDQQVRTLESFGQAVDDARYAELERRSRDGGAIQAAQVIVGVPLAALAMAALIFRVNRRRAPAVAFRAVLAVVVHSGVILAVHHLVLSPLNYVRETLSSPTNVAVLFPMLEDGTIPARFLGTIDLFVLWWIVVLALGLGVLYRRPARWFGVRLFGMYLALALGLAVIMAVAGGF